MCRLSGMSVRLVDQSGLMLESENGSPDLYPMNCHMPPTIIEGRTP